jgi:hypothetical protein
VLFQLVKQLRGNPTSQSVDRGWALLHLCLSTFPPSEEAENYIEHFLRAHGARSIVRALHLSLFRGAVTAVASLAEIEEQLAAGDVARLAAGDDSRSPLADGGDDGSPLPWNRTGSDGGTQSPASPPSGGGAAVAPNGVGVVGSPPARPRDDVTAKITAALLSM